MTVRLFGATLFALFGLSASGQTWTGSVDSDWTNSSNWSGGVPGTNSAVTIPGNVSNSPVITTSVIIKDLTIGDWNNLITLTVDGGSLTVNEDLTINDYGELKLQSGSILLDRTKNNATFTCGYNGTKITLVNGTFTSDLNMSINGEFNSGSANVNLNGTFTIPSNKTGTTGSSGIWTIANTFTVNGVFDAGGANMNFNGDFYVGSGGQFDAGSGALNFSNIFDVGNNGTYNGEDAHSTIVTSISAKNGAYITLNNGILEFQGSVDLFSTATMEVLGTGQVIITGSGQFKQNGSLIIGDGSLDINGNVDFQQGGTLDVGTGSVAISGDATFSQSGTLNIESGSLAITGDANFDQSGTVNATSADITISGNLTLGSNGSEFNAGESTINLEGGTLTNNGTFNADSSTVNFTGDSTQTISGDITFYNVNIETEGSLTTTGNIVVTNNATVDTSASVDISGGGSIEVQGELEDPNGGVVAPTPFVRTIVASSANSVIVTFSENMTTTVNTVGNYSVNNGLTVQSAVQQVDLNKVELTFSGSMTVGVEYTFIFNNLVGATNGQTISLNHTRRYIYKPLIQQPLSGVSGFKVDSKTSSQLVVSWSNPAAEGTLIVIKKGSKTSFLPTDLQSISVSSNLETATNIGDGFAVFAGSDSSVTIEGLLPNENYFLSAFTYNGSFPSTAVYNTLDSVALGATTPFELDIHLVLAGAYNEVSGTMSSNLTELGLLPNSQPFADAPWNYAGTENIASYPSNDIVDWVLVELRATTEAASAVDSTIRARQACFLMNDGSIVGLDGIALPTFQFETGEPFIVVVYHRNHLPIMSSDTLTVNGSGVFDVDFANDATAWYETNSALQAEDGVFMSSSGSSQSNSFYEVDLQAFQKAWTDRNSSGYSESDVNLDGSIDASDRAKIFNSKLNSIQVPNAGAPQ
ncbi:MAG: hypothetical protein HWD92_10295 [Flavobacteriia bacterium]|nr:hypothetical protein [Flavobacteriia bacterium]